MTPEAEKRKPCPHCFGVRGILNDPPYKCPVCKNTGYAPEPQHVPASTEAQNNIAILEQFTAPLGDKLEGSGEPLFGTHVKELVGAVQRVMASPPESSGESLGQREATEPLKADEKGDANRCTLSSPAVQELPSPASSSTASPMAPGEAASIRASELGIKLSTIPIRFSHDQAWNEIAQAAIAAYPARKKLEEALAYLLHSLDTCNGVNIYTEDSEWPKAVQRARAVLAEAETKKEKCRYCQGFGWYITGTPKADTKKTCEVCHGTGEKL